MKDLEEDQMKKLIDFILNKLGLVRKSEYKKVVLWCQLYQEGYQYCMGKFETMRAQLRVEQSITRTFNDLGKDYQKALERIAELDTSARKFRELLLAAEKKCKELEAQQYFCVCGRLVDKDNVVYPSCGSYFQQPKIEE